MHYWQGKFLCHQDKFLCHQHRRYLSVSPRQIPVQMSMSVANEYPCSVAHSGPGKDYISYNFLILFAPSSRTLCLFTQWVTSFTEMQNLTEGYSRSAPLAQTTIFSSIRNLFTLHVWSSLLQTVTEVCSVFAHPCSPLHSAPLKIYKKKEGFTWCVSGSIIYIWQLHTCMHRW